MLHHLLHDLPPGHHLPRVAGGPGVEELGDVPNGFESNADAANIQPAADVPPPASDQPGRPAASLLHRSFHCTQRHDRHPSSGYVHPHEGLGEGNTAIF